MINSIQHFEVFGIKKLEKALKDFYKNPKNFAPFVDVIEETVLGLGRSCRKP